MYSGRTTWTSRLWRWLRVVALIVGVLMVALGLFLYVSIPKVPYNALGRAKSDLATSNLALALYCMDTGRYPSQDESLQVLLVPGSDGTPFLKGSTIRLDSWGRDYVYRRPSKIHPGGYDVCSWRQDGVEGTADDICPGWYGSGEKRGR